MVTKGKDVFFYIYVKGTIRLRHQRSVYNPGCSKENRYYFVPPYRLLLHLCYRLVSTLFGVGTNSPVIYRFHLSKY